jgi:hypothetical protein
MRPSPVVLAGIVAAAAGGEIVAASAQEDPTNIVADQIRAQGYKCDSPQKATRDPQASRPDEQVWILQCESGGYRVRLIPDMAAKVEELDKSQDGNK